MNNNKKFLNSIISVRENKNLELVSRNVQISDLKLRTCLLGCALLVVLAATPFNSSLFLLMSMLFPFFIFTLIALFVMSLDDSDKTYVETTSKSIHVDFKALGQYVSHKPIWFGSLVLMISFAIAGAFWH